jgi:hypothetical protein
MELGNKLRLPVMAAAGSVAALLLRISTKWATTITKIPHLTRPSSIPSPC